MIVEQLSDEYNIIKLLYKWKLSLQREHIYSLRLADINYRGKNNTLTNER